VAKQEDKSNANSKNPITKASSFVRESWQELQKVHKPSRQETVQTAIRVFLFVFMFAFFLGLTDWVMGSLMEYIISG
jgi:preprotein translocase SecE subunit